VIGRAVLGAGVLGETALPWFCSASDRSRGCGTQTRAWFCSCVRVLGLFGVDNGEGEDSGAGLDGGEGEEGGAHSVVAFHPAEKFGGD